MNIVNKYHNELKICGWEWIEFNDIKEDGKTILIATHDIQNIEEKFDEVLCLNRHCCAFGEPSEVLTQEIIEEMYGSHNQILKGHIPGNHGANSGN